MTAEAALESRSNSVTGLKNVHLPDTAICSHPPICNRYGLVHETCYKRYKLSADAGLKQTEHSRLTDLCFADDAALTDDTVGGLEAAHHKWLRRILDMPWKDIRAQR